MTPPTIYQFIVTFNFMEYNNIHPSIHPWIGVKQVILTPHVCISFSFPFP